MIKRTRALPVIAVLTVLGGCGSPTAPNPPANPPDEEDTPKTGLIAVRYPCDSTEIMMVIAV